MTRTAFSQILRTCRAEAGYRSARDFADAIGINENRYSRYERGTSEPNLSLICKIATHLNLTPNDLLGFSQSQAASSHVTTGFAAPSADGLSDHPIPDHSGFSSAAQSAPKAEMLDVLAWRFADAYVRLAASKGRSGTKKIAVSEAEHLTQVARLFTSIKSDVLSVLARLLVSAEFAGAPAVARAPVEQTVDALLAHLLDTPVDTNLRVQRRV